MLGNWKSVRFRSILLLSLGGLILSFSPPTYSYEFPFDSHKALAGTFGELRNNHFHSGIDIKTFRKIGIPIKAVSDAYVYRLKASPFGFGRAVYLKHDDGNFSVYAHLDRFTKDFEEIVYKRQLADQSYLQEIYLPKDHVRVKKGEIIGYSGNSGSSYGPHLHFEIRDKNEKIINPLQYYKAGMIPDHVYPILQEVGFEPLTIDSRVEGKWDKLRLTPSRTGPGTYQIKDLIRVKGDIGMEYFAFDRLDAATNKCGINYAKLFLDGKVIHEFKLDTFDFNESRHINMHIDYGYFKENRKRFQRAYVLNGNEFSAYKAHPGKGVITLNDDQVHMFRLELTDYEGNTSSLTGRMVRDSHISDFPRNPVYYSSPIISYEERHNILKIMVQKPKLSYQNGLIYKNAIGKVKILKPAYYRGTEMVFLLPLDRYNYPRQVQDMDGRLSLQFHFYEELFPDQNNLVELDELQVFIPFRAIFSHHHLQVRKTAGNARMYSDIFEVGNKSIPINKSYLISFDAPAVADREKMVVAKWDGTKWEYAGNVMGTSENVYASLREFGKFCLMADSTAPEVRALNFTKNGTIPAGANHLTLKVDDRFSGINHQTIYGTLDGEWIPFEYFFRQDKIRYDFTNRRPSKGKHTLRVRADDNTGNRTEVQYQLIF